MAEHSVDLQSGYPYTYRNSLNAMPYLLWWIKWSALHIYDILYIPVYICMDTVTIFFVYNNYMYYTVQIIKK